MTPSQDQPPTNDCGDLPAGRAGRYLGACGRVLDSIVPSLMTTMFERLDEVLRDLAGKAVEAPLSSSYRSTGRILREQHQGIQVNFIRLLHHGAAVALSLPPPQPDRGLALPEPDSQELMVPNGAELEEHLVIGNLTTKAETRYRPELLEMRAHLGHLLGRGRLPERSNPYGPFAVCDAFRQALAQAHQLEPRLRLVVYKHFDRHVTDRLGDFYKGCVDLAVADGHVPGSGFAQVRVRVVALTSTMPFEALQGLLAFRRLGIAKSQGPSRAPSADPSSAPAKQDEAPLQSPAGEASLLSSPSEAHSALGVGTGALSRDDADTLELVSLFFRHLVQENDLPFPIKVLLGRLQTPMAKLALVDKSFFSDPEHPARRLLNRTGRAAMGWSEDDDRGPDSLYGMIERVVERLIIDFDGDTSLFAQMDRYMAAFIEREQSSVGTKEARFAPQPSPSVPQSERPVVASVVEEYLTRYPSVPSVIESILREGWQPAMLAVYRTAGRDSAAWRRGLELADRLLWSVQPKLEAEDRRQLLRRIPEILRGLRAQLAGSGVDQPQLARWFRDLQTVHLGVLQGEPGSARSLEPPAPKDVQTDVPPVGSWVELRCDDDRWARFKVAGVSADGACSLLVDRRGRGGAELGHAELRALIDRGLVRLLGDGQEPIADRALRSLLAGLAG